MAYLAGCSVLEVFGMTSAVTLSGLQLGAEGRHLLKESLNSCLW